MIIADTKSKQLKPSVWAVLIKISKLNLREKVFCELVAYGGERVKFSRQAFELTSFFVSFFSDRKNEKSQVEQPN